MTVDDVGTSLSELLLNAGHPARREDHSATVAAGIPFRFTIGALNASNYGYWGKNLLVGEPGYQTRYVPPA
jgi:hypothetical protein